MTAPTARVPPPNAPESVESRMSIVCGFGRGADTTTFTV
jgi:hypothetical protein